MLVKSTPSGTGQTGLTLILCVCVCVWVCVGVCVRACFHILAACKHILQLTKSSRNERDEYQKITFSFNEHKAKGLYFIESVM